MRPRPVLVEVDHLLGRYAGDESFITVLNQVRSGALVIEDLVASDYERAVELMPTYADLKVGFVNCAVLAVVGAVGRAETRHPGPSPFRDDAAASRQRFGVAARQALRPWWSSCERRGPRGRRAVPREDSGRRSHCPCGAIRQESG